MRRALITLILMVLFQACSEPSNTDTETAFNPFRSDYDYSGGLSDCKWLSENIKLHEVGRISFKYRKCEFDFQHDLTHGFKFEDNWLTFESKFEERKKSFIPLLGIFPQNGQDAETVLRKTIFPEILKRPECDIYKDRKTTEDVQHYPNRWRLITAYESNFDGWGRSDISPDNDYPCGVYAEKSGMKGYIISEKRGYIIVLQPFATIDLSTFRFEPLDDK